jgi:integrase
MARSSYAVKHYLSNSLADNTLRAYARDLKRFKDAGGRIPATPDQVARYLAGAASHLKPSTLARQAAAIAHAHVQKNLPSPTTSPLVKKTLRGIKRTHAAPAKQARPLDPKMLRVLASPHPKLSPLQNARDAALFLVAFGGGFRRSELSRLLVGDGTFTSDGLLIRLRRSKTDQFSKGRDVAIPWAAHAKHCAVRALQRWVSELQKVIADGPGLTEHPLFCSIDKHGQIRSGINSASIGWLLKRRLALHGLSTDGFSSHSFRAGLVTSAARSGVPVWAIQRQTGHRSEQTVHRYIRNLGAFECNATAALL